MRYFVLKYNGMKNEDRITDRVKSDDCENTTNNHHFKINDIESGISIHHILHPPKVKIQLPRFIIATLIALVFPLISFAQLPTLGTAENFAIFTTIGALDNTGTSNITGDIGTDNGAIAGFGAPTVVNGTINSGNAVTVQCALDVQAAYNEIFGYIPTVVGHAPAFGSGETLLVGIYFIAAAGSVAGNLTLDAAGDPNAIFIFQFGGEFTTGASTTINLINGALACNVFWIAEGAMSMAAITDMKGTLISNNGAVSMGAGGTLEGRMLSTAGAASVYDVSITTPTCAILPISLLSFTGYCDKQNIVLQWSTATEINNDYFTIERSPDQKKWDIVGTVAGARDLSSPFNYMLTDMAHHEGTTYYRLKETDFSGNYKYEDIIDINKCEDNEADHFTIYPNPSEGKFKLLFNGNTSEINSINIFDAKGRNIYSSIVFQSAIDLSDNVPGLYSIHFKTRDGEVTKKFVKK